MNPVFRAASEANELGWLMALMTVLFVTFFSAWVWWAYRPANKERMEAWGRIPLDDDEPAGGEA